MGGTIVCGVTEAVEARNAAEVASAFGARLGFRLVLVSVVEGVPLDAQDSLSGRQRQSGAEQALAEIARDVGDGAETRVVLGQRAESLAQVAAEEGADLIVVGSRSAGLANRKVRSATARELEAVTPVPVLVAPPSTRRRSEARLASAASSGTR
jgi:nucleotide-binding universal stress UspA family protein